MKYTKSTTVSGSWVDKSKLVNDTKAKIVSETKPVPSTFTSQDGTLKTQDVAKVLFQGQKEAVNVTLNKATISGLVEAFGEDSVNWQNKVLSVEVEKMRVAGKAVIALYLIPDGFKKIDNDDGYAVIIPENLEKADDLKYPDEPNPEDIPF